MTHSLAAVDLFHVVDDPSVTPINKKIMQQKMYLITYLHILGLKQTSQTITADGSTNTAVNVTTAITEINATSATHTALADGSDGQIKIILNISTSGTNKCNNNYTNKLHYFINFK